MKETDKTIEITMKELIDALSVLKDEHTKEMWEAISELKRERAGEKFEFSNEELKERILDRRLR